MFILMAPMMYSARACALLCELLVVRLRDAHFDVALGHAEHHGGRVARPVGQRVHRNLQRDRIVRCLEPCVDLNQLQRLDLRVERQRQGVVGLGVARKLEREAAGAGLGE